MPFDAVGVDTSTVSDYQAIHDAEWDIYRKLEAIPKTGAKVVRSKLSIRDLATRWLADGDICCAGCASTADLRRIVKAVADSV
jgi:chaperonin GroEL (HSP60 family)